MTADQYIGGTLQAAKPLITYGNPESMNIKRQINTNGLVGTIVSYLVRNKNEVWWQTDKNDFVKHETGAFNIDVLWKSLIAQEEQRKKELQDAIDKKKNTDTNPFANIAKLFENLSDSLMTALIIFILVSLLKSK